MTYPTHLQLQSADYELLLPVGQKEMAEAAIQNGADAIYVGFPGFNARGRSYDFEIEELRHIIDMCHLNGVKVNLAFNIVIFENELQDVMESIKKVLPLKPDALIVQDLGLVQIVKKMCPQQVVHASTQMTITNDLAIALLEDLDIKRFVLGRENSIPEIKLIAQRTKKELEVFVHGALCVSYSGQCFTSETLGGRSANRGQCAQSCRFSYDLIVDGEKKNLVDRNYLVSPQDLCGIAEIPKLMEMGVKSLKVEGRLKTPEYVAQVAKSYRAAIDAVIAEKKLTESQLEAEKSKMAVEYSRGFFPGWLHGVDHQKLVNGTFSAHRGLEIGKIAKAQNNKIEVQLNRNYLTIEDEIEGGDGLSWVEKGEKKGASIYSVKRSGSHLLIEFAHSFSVGPAAVGSYIYLNHDKSQKREIEKSLTDRNQFRKSNVEVTIELEVDKPMRALVSDGRFQVEHSTVGVLTQAQKKPLTEDFLYDEFSSLANTVFRLSRESFHLNFVGNRNLFLNHKEIKNLRQNLFLELSKLRQQNRIDFKGPVEVRHLELQTGMQKTASNEIHQIGLNVLLRNKEQVVDFTTAVENKLLTPDAIKSVCLDFEFGRDYKGSVDKLKQMGIKVGVATTRILKPQEYINLKIIHSMNPDFILVRNLGALYYFQNVQKFDGELKGDFSLNVTNHVTFDYLLQKGLSTVCLSYDLNLDQTASLLQNVDAQRAEVTIHQSMPSFHMEHCVFAAFLSEGSSYKDCGKPCEKHKVQLKDQFGHYHWIKPDHECRNTMYNSSAQTALPYLQEWKTLGLGEIRFEALHESGEELIRKIKNYTDVLTGDKTIQEALADLQTTEGSSLLIVGCCVLGPRE